ncbi:hypothetical protein QQG55_55795 [Brugia pahangi]
MYDTQTVNTIHGCMILRQLTQFMDVCYSDRYRNSWMYNAESVNYNSWMYDTQSVNYNSWMYNAESVNYNSWMYDFQTVNTIHGCMIFRPLTQFMDVCYSDR